MHPYNAAQGHSAPDTAEDNSLVVKDPVPCECADYLVEYAHSRKKYHINSRMGIEPEEVLVYEGASTHCRIEEVCAEVLVKCKHCNSHAKDWNEYKLKHKGGHSGPYEYIQLAPCYPRSPHTNYCGQKIDASGNG